MHAARISLHAELMKPSRGEKREKSLFHIFLLSYLYTSKIKCIYIYIYIYIYTAVLSE